MYSAVTHHITQVNTKLSRKVDILCLKTTVAGRSISMEEPELKFQLREKTGQMRKGFVAIAMVLKMI